MSPQVHIGENERRGASSGFSLIEMVVAVAIMGLALSVLYQSLSGATRNTRIASEYAAATALAESTIDEFTRSLEAGDAGGGASRVFTAGRPLPAPQRLSRSLSQSRCRARVV
jgi:prepilin-type N-terminal cleavage/methylation domain-containing protein